MKKTKHERLVDRVRKLYAMAQQTEQSPQEAEAALRNCLKLMDRHGITAADLGTSKFGAASVINDESSGLAYVQIMASAAAALHDCIAIVFPGDKGLEIRGHDVDVLVANMTFDYIRQCMTRAEAESIGPGRMLESSARHKLHWRSGFAEAVANKVNTIVDQRKQDYASQAGTGTSLVVQKLDAVNANCRADVSGNINAEDIYQPQNNLATLVGAEAGDRVSFNTQIGGEDSATSRPVLAG